MTKIVQSMFAALDLIFAYHRHARNRRAFSVLVEYLVHSFANTGLGKDGLGLPGLSQKGKKLLLRALAGNEAALSIIWYTF